MMSLLLLLFCQVLLVSYFILVNALLNVFSLLLLFKSSTFVGFYISHTSYDFLHFFLTFLYNSHSPSFFLLSLSIIVLNIFLCLGDFQLGLLLSLSFLLIIFSDDFQTNFSLCSFFILLLKLFLLDFFFQLEYLLSFILTYFMVLIKHS